MGFFSNLFAKQNCVFCGKECGAMRRTKIKGNVFVCNDCADKCSRYVRLSEMTQDEVRNHMEYMAYIKRVYDEVFCNEQYKKNRYPSTVSTNDMGIVMCNDLGMLYILDRTAGAREMPELIRYDQIASYEEYMIEEPAKEQGKEPAFKAGGLKLKLVQPRGLTKEEESKGMQPHPYIKKEIDICFSKKDKRTAAYAHGAKQQLDYIFGVRDDEKALFGGWSTAEKRDFQGTVGMLKAMGTITKAAVKGENALSEEQKANLKENLNAVNDAQTGGLSVYSRRADEAMKLSDMSNR